MTSILKIVKFLDITSVHFFHVKTLTQLIRIDPLQKVKLLQVR